MLTDTAVKQVKSREKLYKMGDSDGLSLWVQPSGGKLWRFQYSFQGKVHRMSLGTYPEISLREARERRDTYRKMVANGVNPLKEKREKQQTIEAEAQEASNTFAHIAEQWCDTNLPHLSEKHAVCLKENYLKKRILPAIGRRPISTLISHKTFSTSSNLLKRMRKPPIRSCNSVVKFWNMLAPLA